MPKQFFFGPLVADFDDLRALGWRCPICQIGVIEARKALSGTPWMMAFRRCSCGTVAHFVGDPGPDTPGAWKRAMRFMKRQKTELLVLNLNPNSARSFGRN